ncbi:gag-pol polyprotein, related [Cucumis melo var. makuwa]|uniref:Gag-pol polyprotein, related n=1 Tax=Cucumis melo var. makuwa TaxID=1194695 RepID=A0A5D3CNH1_CUCMM|nr:gag-pol polyprotein, related [Cucumis melo var. makuwa]
MTEEETIAEFNVRFNMKVTTIEEANDLSKMKLDELFGSLQTFELHLEEDYERGEKDYGTSKFEKNGKGIRCHECEGFEHIQSECTTYLKCEKKSLVATLSDEENYLESDDEEVGKVLISSIILNEEGMENEISQVPDQQATMSNKSLNESTLKRKWEEDQATIVYQQERIQYLMEENQSFLSSIVTLKEELKEARNQFEELSKSVALTSVYNPNSTNQYVDSGCSSHMTGNASFFFELSECNARLVMYNYSSVHTMVVTHVKSYQSTIFALVHHSFASFESSHMTPIDVVGTAPIVICLSMFLFQGSHIPDVSAKFDTASSDSRASSAVSPTVGQPLVLSMTCVHALMVESLSLTGQISKFSI